MSLEHSVDLDEADLAPRADARRLFSSTAEGVPDALRARAAEVCLLLAAGEEIEPGVRVGGLEVLRTLGRGGQATVYLARREDGTRLALKIPRLDVGERLVREAKILRSLEHERIVRIVEATLDGPLPYLAMEWLEGGTLADLLAERGRLPLESVRSIAAAVLEALRFAHGRGVVHRDVKPANILFDGRGFVRVADFGIGTVGTAEKSEQPIAHSLARSFAATGTLFAGTPAYMAPEQEDPARADAGKVDGRADLFALGKVIHEALTGRSPRTLRPVARDRADVPPEWDAFIFKLVEERPQDRFGSAAEAAAILARLPGERPARRKWRLVAEVLTLFVGTIFAGKAAAFLAERLTPAQLQAVVGAIATTVPVAAACLAIRWLARRPRPARPGGPLDEARERAARERSRDVAPLRPGPLEETIQPDVATVADPHLRERWVQKMHAVAAGVRHPNVVRVLRVEGSAAVVERFEARTLQEVLAAGPLSLGTAASYVLQVADGLAAIHAAEAGPAEINSREILVSASGEVKLRFIPRAKSLPAGADVEALASLLTECLSGTPTPEHLERDILKALEAGGGPAAVWIADVLRPYATGPDTPPNALVGQRVRHYRVQAYVARDATGCHYRAKDELDREVALTLVNPKYRQGEDLGRRFEAAARITHPMLQRVVQRFERAFLVLEPIGGPTLDHRGFQPPWRPRRAAAFAADIADAVQPLAESGFHLAGITPDSIRLDDDLSPILERWPLRDDPSILRLDPRELPYLAPELAAGGTPDRAATVYTLGAILFERLTGNPPSTPDARPSAAGPDVPEKLDAIVQRALSSEPARRFASPGEMARQLRAWIVQDGMM